MADVELLPLPEWTKRDDLGGLVPSEVRAEMRYYARANLAPLQDENERLRVALYELRERCAQECERLASSQCNTSIGEAWKLGALACADEIRAMTLAKGGAV